MIERYKLNNSTLYPQTLALLMHELVHAFGKDEETAQAIQKSSVEYFALATKDATQAYLERGIEKIVESQEYLEAASTVQEYFINDSTLHEVLKSRILSQQEELPFLLLSPNVGRHYVEFVSKLIYFRINYEANQVGSFGDIYANFGQENQISCSKYFVSEDGGPINPKIYPLDCVIYRLLMSDAVYNWSIVKNSQIDFLKSFNAVDQFLRDYLIKQD